MPSKQKLSTPPKLDKILGHLTVKSKHIFEKVGATMTILESFIQFVESLTPEQADFIFEHLRLSIPSSGSEVQPDEEEVQPLLQEVS